MFRKIRLSAAALALARTLLGTLFQWSQIHSVAETLEPDGFIRRNPNRESVRDECDARYDQSQLDVKRVELEGTDLISNS